MRIPGFDWLKPRLFLSYAHEDSAFAKRVFRELTDAGFEVYYDVEKTLAGERFHAVISREMRRCDGVVAILSPSSAASPWCQAELHYAHALEKAFVPLRLGSEPFELAEPLRPLEQSVQHIAARDSAEYDEALHAVHGHLRTARQRRWTRLMLRGAAILAVSAGLVYGWIAGIARINDLSRARERASVLQRVHDSKTNLTRDAVSAIVEKSSDDPQLAASLLVKMRNRELSDIERINATLVANALLLPRMPEKRWALQKVDWNNSDLRRADFTDITFMSGQLRDVRFADVTFAGVSWNQAPSQGKDGLMLSNTVFDTCRFYSGWFRGTGGISVNFQNCRFRGTWVDVRAFGAVRFRSQQREPDSPVITDEITVFENAVLSRCVAPPERGVLEIVPPGSEVEFSGVIFDGSRLRGRIRAEWFRKCHFQRCILPTALSRKLLEQEGNTVEDCIWIDEPCDWR